MENAEYSDGGQHRTGFEDVEDPFMIECVAVDPLGEFDEAVDGADLMSSALGLKVFGVRSSRTKIRVDEMYTLYKTLRHPFGLSPRSPRLCTRRWKFTKMTMKNAKVATCIARPANKMFSPVLAD